MSNSSQLFESYVPVYDAVPEKWEDARPFLVEMFKKISNAVNIREIGWFLDEELLSGKQFVPSGSTPTGADPNQLYRSILRKVINFGALPNTTTKSVPHGISFTNQFTLIQLYGAATQPSTLAIPISDLAPYGTTISIDPININITTTTNLNAFTVTWITLEYLQEV